MYAISTGFGVQQIDMLVVVVDVVFVVVVVVMLVLDVVDAFVVVTRLAFEVEYTLVFDEVVVLELVVAMVVEFVVVVLQSCQHSQVAKDVVLIGWHDGT